MNRRVYYPGDRIFEEGAIGDAAFLIQTGKVRIFKTMPSGEVQLGVLGAGSIFGEMAMIDEHPRMASAEALETTTVVFVNRSMFQKKMAETDPFLHSILRLLVRNARSISEMLSVAGKAEHL